MARFDRQPTEAKVSTSLDLATENLESFVADKVREILEAAVSKAEQIEREAGERAEQTRREAERKSEALLDEAFTRAWRILDGIDLLENGVGDMIGALRAEMEGFAADLGSGNGAVSRRAASTGASSPSTGNSEPLDSDHADVD